MEHPLSIRSVYDNIISKKEPNPFNYHNTWIEYDIRSDRIQVVEDNVDVVTLVLALHAFEDAPLSEED